MKIALLIRNSWLLLIFTMMHVIMQLRYFLCSIFQMRLACSLKLRTLVCSVFLLLEINALGSLNCWGRSLDCDFLLKKKWLSMLFAFAVKELFNVGQAVHVFYCGFAVRLILYASTHVAPSGIFTKRRRALQGLRLGLMKHFSSSSRSCLLSSAGSVASGGWRFRAADWHLQSWRFTPAGLEIDTILTWSVSNCRSVS